MCVLLQTNVCVCQNSFNCYEGHLYQHVYIWFIYIYYFWELTSFCFGRLQEILYYPFCLQDIMFLWTHWLCAASKVLYVYLTV